jgi:ribosomal protein L12E/L44/L45/RPP1/RPP2
VQDPFYFEHLRQEGRWEPGAVPFRVSARPEVVNDNTTARLAKVVANIKLTLAQYVRPVSVPFAPVARDAVGSENGEDDEEEADEDEDPDAMHDDDDDGGA